MIGLSKTTLPLLGFGNGRKKNPTITLDLFVKSCYILDNEKFEHSYFRWKEYVLCKAVCAAHNSILDHITFSGRHDKASF